MTDWKGLKWDYCVEIAASDTIENYSYDSVINMYDQPPLKEELLKKLKEKMKLLTPRQQQIIDLIYVQKKTQQEAAKIMGINQSCISLSIKSRSKYGHGGIISRLKYMIAGAECRVCGKHFNIDNYKTAPPSYCSEKCKLMYWRRDKRRSK